METKTSDALDLMGAQALTRSPLPDKVPFGEAELAAGASSGNFLFFVPRGSVANKFLNREARTTAIIPASYKGRPELAFEGRAEWVLAKFDTGPTDMTLGARYLADLVTQWNRHEYLRQHYRIPIFTSTMFEDKPLQVCIMSRPGEVRLYRDKPGKNPCALIGVVRSVIGS